MTDQHADAAYVGACTEAACELIDNRLMTVAVVDGAVVPVVPAPPYPSRLWRAAVGVSIRLYRYKDAEADISETWSAGTQPVRIPRDPLAGYDNLIDGSRHAWGIG